MHIVANNKVFVKPAKRGKGLAVLGEALVGLRTTVPVQ